MSEFAETESRWADLRAKAIRAAMPGTMDAGRGAELVLFEDRDVAGVVVVAWDGAGQGFTLTACHEDDELESACNHVLVSDELAERVLAAITQGVTARRK